VRGRRLRDPAERRRRLPQRRHRRDPRRRAPQLLRARRPAPTLAQAGRPDGQDPQGHRPPPQAGRPARLVQVRPPGRLPADGRGDQRDAVDQQRHGERHLRQADRQGRRPQDLSRFLLDDAQGTFGTSKPFPVELPDRPGAIRGLGGEEKSTVFARWSCETNLAEGIKLVNEPGATSIDLPAGIPIKRPPVWPLQCPLRADQGCRRLPHRGQVNPTFDPGGEGVALPIGKKLPYSFQTAGLLRWQDEKNFVRIVRSKKSDGPISMKNQLVVEVDKNGRVAAYHYIDIPDQPIQLAVFRKGGSIRLLFLLPPKRSQPWTRWPSTSAGDRRARLESTPARQHDLD